MKKWNLDIKMGNDTAHFIINNKKKNVELYTSAREHWCIDIQSCLPTDSVPLDGTPLAGLRGVYPPTSSNQSASTRRFQLSIAAKAVRPKVLLSNVKIWVNTD